MASKAVARVKVDWSSISNQLSPKELPKLNKLKSQVDSTVAKASSLPDKLPSIDWAHYKAHASDPNLVAELEKQYAKVKLEHPKAIGARLNELRNAQVQTEERYKKFVEISKSYVESARAVRVKFEKMIPVPEMNNEDWTLTFPYWSVTRENPSVAFHYGRIPGLTREEAISFEQPDPLPFSTKIAWKDWEERKKKFYS